jgi:hypothetical protein
MKLSNLFKLFNKDLTKEQKAFLDVVCGGGKWELNSKGEVDVFDGVDMSNMGLPEIPVKFGVVGNSFNCSFNNLTTLKNHPEKIGWFFNIQGNNLSDYFKSINEEDFKYWGIINQGRTLREYPFLINIIKKHTHRVKLEEFLDRIPQTKLYYRD